jgi:hypothetical protein
MNPVRFRRNVDSRVEKEPTVSPHDQAELDEASPEEVEQAARSIQNHWRLRARGDAFARGKTSSLQNAFAYPDTPFYTHTLGLTYAGAKKKTEEREKPLGEQLFLLLDDPDSSAAAGWLSLFIIAVTIISIFGFVLETVDEVYDLNPEFWMVLEVACTLVFTVEYAAHLATCQFAGVSTISFVLAPLSLCDLMAVAPFYVELILNSTGVANTTFLKAFKVVRLIRVMRVFKLGRYAAGIGMMGQALWNSSQAISILMFLMGVGVVLFSSTLFYMERLSCPSKGSLSGAEAVIYANECGRASNRGVSPTHGLCCTKDGAPNDFPSIVAACWWAVVTMTSVGYGEVYPRTVQGKLVGCMAMITGLLLIALPIAIIGEKFRTVYEINDKKEKEIRVRQRMGGGPNETWTLIPGSEVLERLKALEFKDSDADAAIRVMTDCFEEIWEKREALGRERKYALAQRGRLYKGFGKLITAIEVQ